MAAWLSVQLKARGDEMLTDRTLCGSQWKTIALRAVVAGSSVLATLIAPVSASSQAGATLSTCSCNAQQTLYAVTPTRLYRIDSYDSTPAAVLIASLPYTFLDIAFHPTTGRLYAAEPGFARLYEIDPATGATTSVGPFGVLDQINALEFSFDGTLYARGSVVLNALYTIDLSSGAATVVGNGTGSWSGGGLALGTDNVLYSTSPNWAAPNSLEIIDRSTGVASFVAYIQAPTNVGALEINCDGVMYGATVTSLYRIDALSGGATLLASLPLPDHIWGLAFRCAAVPPIVAYCTAGTSSQGCVAHLQHTGTASASAASGFVLSANQVDGQRFGLFFYGLGGALATPWGASSSYLCVKPPTQRTQVQSTGGAVSGCTGSLSLDWNQYVAMNPSALGAPFGGGEQVFAQAWLRDPASPKGTGLSDALQFVVQP